ncbi:YtxH domain-containing protein [Acetobacterium tundrae]|uniref:YtxH domain-containing protein n=1 Tax=Acetobacterium tundrae TaxID=132932 RepID=A0ABR6WL07_9FIRM|nr:YtxH domain-containing protein [Acetobacterium tundrae]MBC3797193.1 YtxH domain-containing protein [Acetobacterium tundrae]
MSSNKLYFVGGLFLGTIIGGTLGVLMAPTSGLETRKKLAEGTEEVLGNAYDQAVEYGENLKEQFQDMQEQFTERVNEYKNQIENKIQEIQDEVEQDIADLSDELEALEKEDSELAAGAKVITSEDTKLDAEAIKKEAE